MQRPEKKNIEMYAESPKGLMKHITQEVNPMQTNQWILQQCSCAIYFMIDAYKHTYIVLWLSGENLLCPKNVEGNGTKDLF